MKSIDSIIVETLRTFEYDGIKIDDNNIALQRLVFPEEIKIDGVYAGYINDRTMIDQHNDCVKATLFYSIAVIFASVSPYLYNVALNVALLQALEDGGYRVTQVDNMRDNVSPTYQHRNDMICEQITIQFAIEYDSWEVENNG